MSEYQYLAFRACDKPLDATSMAFMRKQSTRAEITRWSFENEYHFGDFHGDADEMLRRGYDVHIHYANFGSRRLSIRLPHGLPNRGAALPYLDDDSLVFVKDQHGQAGILTIDPAYEPDDLEELWELAGFIDRLAPLRNEILSGDLRPLYLAHLAVSCDCNHDPEETQEAPIPAGLESLTAAQEALCEFYGIGETLLAAAAQGASPAPIAGPGDALSGWLKSQAHATKDAWLARLATDSEDSVRAEILARFHEQHVGATWHTTPSSRTIADLLAAEEELRNAPEKKKPKLKPAPARKKK
jgi:hypothetical protein